MLTQEQIKNLKPGDNLALSYPLHFREYDSEHDELLAENNGEYIYFHAADVELPSEHGTEVPPPKHDPCRLFKKGDKVRIVEYKGRNNTGRKIGEIGIVYRNESPGTAEVEVVFEDDDLWEIDPAYLEIVTPIEEREPYSIYESKEEESFDIMKRVGKLYLTRNCIYYKSDNNDHAELTREEALAAAEAERDRLNAEWRKEQNND